MGVDIVGIDILGVDILGRHRLYSILAVFATRANTRVNCAIV